MKRPASLQNCMCCGSVMPALDWEAYAEHFPVSALGGLMRKLSSELEKAPSGAEVFAWYFCHGCGWSGPLIWFPSLRRSA